jgi:catechol 2,3-dioxygenase-like lactoylglutathione lyase family enzyme
LLLTIYVSDVKRSAAFYRDVLGFDCLGFYDYDSQCYVDPWVSDEPPVYAGFIAGDQKFGLHRPMNDYQKQCVGKGRCYFEVRDLDRHHRRVLERKGEPSKISDTTYLKMFHVRDPDGRYIFFAVTQRNSPIYPW